MPAKTGWLAIFRPFAFTLSTPPDAGFVTKSIAGLSLLLLAGTPLAAQPTDTDAELKALIPDSALAHPEDWAKHQAPDTEPPAASPVGTPTASPAASPVFGAETGQPLSPTSPLPDIPALTIAWPDWHLDLPPLPPLTGDDAAIATVKLPEPAPPPGTASPRPRRSASPHQHDRLASGHLLLDWQSTAIPERTELEARFREVSVLQNPPGKDKEQDNLIQLGVRAASDRDMLTRLLRIYGYYDAEVYQTLASSPTATAHPAPGKATAPLVRFDIVPGSRYRFGTIALPGLDAAAGDEAALRKSFAIATGDPLYSDAIVTQTANLDTALGESGYPFAKLAPPSLIVDHEREEGDLTMAVTPGGKYRFGTIESGNPHLLSSRHLARIARFRPGHIYKRSQVEDFKGAILATGLVSSLTITPRVVAPSAPSSPAGPATAQAPAPASPTAQPATAAAALPGTVALDVAMTPAPSHTISAAAGYDTAEGFRLETSWEARNLFPPEGSLRLRGIAGTDEQLAGVTFRRSNFGSRDRALTFDLYAQNANLIAYAARKVSFSATYEQQTALLFRHRWTWSVGAEAEASDEREGYPAGTALQASAPASPRHMYVTGALPLRTAYDGSDSLLDPRHGWRASLRISPEVSFTRGITSPYVVLEGNASFYLPLAPGVTFAGRGRLGSIIGVPLADIAPSRRFYAGGGGSIRGFGYDMVSPRDPVTQAIEGGRSVYELSGEIRFHTGLMGGALSLAPFLDTGGVEPGISPRFSTLRKGAGLGFLFTSGIGPVHFDIGTPLDPHPGDSRIGVYVSLGQAF